MSLFTTESLENLRKRIDLVDVLSSHIEMKRAGVAYKALCPFHDEKTPSFTVQKGDTHYHCYGCGAHGDAIQFLMDYVRMSFREAIESLSQRFGVVLELMEEDAKQTGPRKSDLKEALAEANRLYHFLLLHTEEGHTALEYLYGRDLTLDFIERFQLGLAPRQGGIFQRAMHAKGFHDDVLAAAGLIKERDDHSVRDFFYDRITFPIRDASGAVIGFSARKYREETFGGKYINTTETPLFKKSRILYGLSECRRRIAKERQAIVVEGQLDALALIHAGLNLAVAALGTAFGEGHVAELETLGLRRVYLAMDADNAGTEATRKVGDLFVRRGIEVRVVRLPSGSDPDAVIRDQGIDSFVALLEQATDYLTFLVDTSSRNIDLRSPAAKTQLLQQLCEQIRQWDHPVMVHESLRRLAHLLQVPEEMVTTTPTSASHYLIRKSANAGLLEINPDRILETDLLRWLMVSGGNNFDYYIWVRQHLAAQDLRDDVCRSLFQAIDKLAINGQQWDPITLATEATDPRVQELFDTISSKKVTKERSEQALMETIQKILDRNWMLQCEEISGKLRSGQCSDEESLKLLQEFNTLKKNPPKVQARGGTHV